MHVAKLALVVIAGGCVAEADGRDDAFTGADGKADAFGIADKTAESLGVLRLVNDATPDLLDEIGVTPRAASAIVARRAGADRVLGTADDREITSLTKLDAIDWVGPITFQHLYDHAEASGYIEPFGTALPFAARVVAIGDVHGDVDAARRALRLAGAIDAHDHWSGGDLVVVQVGDVLDREDGERAILDLFARLEDEARAAGGRFVMTLGNHEIMNAQGDFRYVTAAGFAAFADVAPTDSHDPAVLAFPRAQRGRAAAFLPGGRYARQLARHDVVVKLGTTLFVHAGLTRSHVTYGLDRLDYEARAMLLWNDLSTPAILDADDGPVWLRDLGEAELTDCAGLARTLAAAGATRLVIGHTVQETGITSACDGAVWRIDVGMSRAYGGVVEVLELGAAAPRVLRER